MYKIKLSPYHKIFYNEWKLNSKSYKYNIVFDQLLDKYLDVDRLQRALYRFIQDHLLLNSHIEHIDDELYWVENTEIATLEYFKTPYTYQKIFDYVSKPFEIETKALYRSALFTENDGSYRFIFALHHLLIDGSAAEKLISEISNYYNLPQYKINYSILEQKSILESSTKLFDEQLEQFGMQYQHFWAEQLNDIEPVDLRWAKSENNINHIKENRFNFSQEDTVRLTRISRALGITNYIYSQCIFAILLHKYTGQNKFGFSYPIAIKGGLPLISGVCINTNISIYEFNTTTKIIELFQQTKNFIKIVKSTGRNAGHYPINDIVNNINKDLLQVMFALTNLKDQTFNFIDVRTLKINSEFNIDLPTTIIFELERHGHTLNFKVHYNTLNIDERIINNFIQQYKILFLNILSDLAASITDKKVNEYLILSELEYNKIIYTWNKTNKPCLSDKTIHELFEEQVIKTPNNLALVYQDNKLTYAQLNEQSNQLANYLKIKYDIKGDDLIALCLDRSHFMLITILGVLKSGGAYVPIDPTYPPKRICYILGDIKAKLIITNHCHYTKLSVSCVLSQSNCIDIFVIDNHDTQYKLRQQATTNLKSNIAGNNLTYVMYTSGTTGNPKGVMLEHRSVIIRIMSMIEKSSITNNSKYLFKTNYTFDVSFSDMFMTLLSGASLYITKSVFDIEEIIGLFTKHNITICHFVPSQLDLIRNCLSEKGLLSKLEVINLSGEGFNKLLINENINPKYINYYGPTETGEVSYDITDFKSQLSSHPSLVTIGYPLDQAKLYILDSYLKPLPIGAIGELYIGGAGLARGYLNNVQLTQERFIDNIFATKEEQELGYTRLYKTGDLARYLVDGNIEYIGRSDNQAKINGLRIELSGIETKLLSYSGIKQAVVILHQESSNAIGVTQQYIVAYYVSQMKLDESLILEYLAQELPEYMLPTSLVYLESFPLTSNGKLNRQLLPQVNFTTNINNYIAPRNESEQKICAMYAEVLGMPINQIGVNDSFFKLGGNSILAISLVFKLQHYFVVTVNNIFEYKTPAKLAMFLLITNINLIDKLEQIKLGYSKLSLDKEVNHLAIKHQYALYQQQVKLFTFDNEIKPTSKILLTGATGYLGCHILYQLLSTTNHLIYLPIRVDGKDISYAKLHNKFKYYFDIDLNIYFDRISIFSSDLTQTNLGLNKFQYQELVNNIDSVIHSAALVKHYGSNKKFYMENVCATTNLLELSKLTVNKDFHYISTIGIFANTRISDTSYNIFIEDNINNSQANLGNIYAKTKYEGEQITLKYREYGVKTNIYRIGNLAINSATYKTQENIEDNAFFQRIKTILKLGIIAKELSEVEISPVDSTATAIVMLFNQAKLFNQIYHIFNPQKINLYNLLNKNKTACVKQVPFSKFIDNVLMKLRDNDATNQIELFMLHQGWLQNNINNLVKPIIFQNRTHYLLSQLKFKWPIITNKMLTNIIQKC